VHPPCNKPPAPLLVPVWRRVVDTVFSVCVQRVRLDTWVSVCAGHSVAGVTAACSVSQMSVPVVTLVVTTLSYELRSAACRAS
jgi:hypothetical protein